MCLSLLTPVNSLTSSQAGGVCYKESFRARMKNLNAIEFDTFNILYAALEGEDSLTALQSGLGPCCLRDM